MFNLKKLYKKIEFGTHVSKITKKVVLSGVEPWSFGS
jgi:hypothetical protein